MPVVLIAREQGLALANLAAQNPSLVAVITPGLAEVLTGAPERITDFSSLGPSIGLRDLKPEIAATGTSMYMPTQSFDPAGAMYNPSGYTVSSGTSFSAPLVAGAVALVKQRNPGFTPLQLKSAVVNTSDREVIVPGSVTDVLATGAGKLHAGAAVGTTLTVEPSTVSFGVIAENSLPDTQQFVLSNRSTIARNVQLAVQPRNMPGQTQLSLSENHLLLHPVRRGRSRSHCRAGPPRADLTAERSRSKALRQSSTCPACS
jgi:subtilisin family serine protease